MTWIVVHVLFCLFNRIESNYHVIFLRGLAQDELRSGRGLMPPWGRHWTRHTWIPQDTIKQNNTVWGQWVTYQHSSLLSYHCWCYGYTNNSVCLGVMRFLPVYYDYANLDVIKASIIFAFYLNLSSLLEMADYLASSTVAFISIMGLSLSWVMYGG